MPVAHIALPREKFDKKWEEICQDQTEPDVMAEGETIGPNLECPNTLLFSGAIVYRLTNDSNVANWEGGWVYHPKRPEINASSAAYLLASSLGLPEFLQTYSGLVGPEAYAYAAYHPDLITLRQYVQEYQPRQNELGPLERACCMVKNHVAWSRLAFHLQTNLLCVVGHSSHREIYPPDGLSREAIYTFIGGIYLPA